MPRDEADVAVLRDEDRDRAAKAMAESVRRSVSCADSKDGLLFPARAFDVFGASNRVHVR